MKTRYTFIFALFVLLCTSCKDKDKEPEPDNSCAGFAVTAQVDEDDISIQTTGGTAPYTYSLDGSNYGASNLFANKAMGDYTVYAKDAQGCVQSAPATVNAFTDARDGQTYKTVKIGSQVWMAENLNYVVDSSWCYENAPENCAKYGRLYNFNGAQLACPAGWHIPSNAEWSVLEKTLGMSDAEIGKGGSRGTNEGDKLKVGGSTGFNAIMAGMYQGGGGFYDINDYTFFWSSTSSNGDANYMICRALLKNESTITGEGHIKADAGSVRCIKD